MDVSLFGIPVQVSESLGRDEFWIVSERAAKAFADFDAGEISKNERDAILGEELFYNRAVITFIR